MYVFVSEDHTLHWHSSQIWYPLERKLLLLLFYQNNKEDAREEPQA